MLLQWQRYISTWLNEQSFSVGIQRSTRPHLCQVQAEVGSVRSSVNAAVMNSNARGHTVEIRLFATWAGIESWYTSYRSSQPKPTLLPTTIRTRATTRCSNCIILLCLWTDQSCCSQMKKVRTSKVPSVHHLSLRYA